MGARDADGRGFLSWLGAESSARPSGVDGTSKEYATAVNPIYRTERALARLALRAMRLPA
jgi:hypothetical protein